VSSSKSVFQRLFLGLFLIALASGILLGSDLDHRQAVRGRQRKVALLQWNSSLVMEDSVRGIVAGLAESGFADGKGIRLKRYNPEGDTGTGNSIAREVTDGRYDIVITTSTPFMQMVARANAAGRTTHVFGVTADPAGAGVGISRTNPLDHPRHMVGAATNIPVDASFELARQCYPGLKRVGVAWNPSEDNSRHFLKGARAACQRLGIELLEANVDNSSAVREAAASLVGRGAQALWAGGDNTLAVAIDTYIGVARQAGIPAFTVSPVRPGRGTLFDLGPNFFEVGRQTGQLAARVLGGADPATLPIENVAPRKLFVDVRMLHGLKEPWQVPEAIRHEADAVVDAAGTHVRKSAEALPRPPAGRTFKIGVVYFGPDPGTDNCLQGLMDGLRELGFEEGRNLQLRKDHAQGEIANIAPIMQNDDRMGLDLVLPMSTPCLTGALSTMRNTPIVFTYVYDPIAAGAGASFTDHLPNVTGVGSFPPIGETIDVLEQIVPGLQVVGTLYNNSEANSRKVVGVGRDLLRKRGIRLEEVTVTGTSEVFPAAQALAQRHVQAIWIAGDNTAIQAFEGIVKAANAARLPLVINDTDMVNRGALAAIGIGFYQSGHAAARKVAQVLLGQNPKEIPIENVAVKQVVLNDAVARQLGVSFPADLRREAGK